MIKVGLPVKKINMNQKTISSKLFIDFRREPSWRCIYVLYFLVVEPPTQKEAPLKQSQIVQPVRNKRLLLSL